MHSTGTGNWPVEDIQQEGIFSYANTNPTFNQLDGSVPGGQPTTLHEEILRLCRETGVEDLAKKAGIIQNNEILELKHYDQDAKGLNALSSSPSTFSSNCTSTATTTVLNTGGRRGRKRKSPSRSVSPSRNSTNPSSLPSSQQSCGSNTLGSSQELENFEEGKRRGKVREKVDKSNKGLRHFSRKVCEKVEQKKVTTYNEVADELVAEFNNAPEKAGGSVDQKNIRRRVYDALNVLMAMNIIRKDKKEIRWIGLPATNAKEEIALLQSEKEARIQRIRKKKEYLQELEMQQTLYKNLLARNMMHHTTEPENERIFLPFIIIHTKKQTQIDCEMSEDKTEYFFDFTLPFSIHDDNEILKRMGLANPPTTLLSGSSLPVNSNTNPISEGGVTMNSTSNSNSITSDNNQHNTNMNMNAMNTNPNVPISTPGKIHKHIVINPSSSPLCQGINGVAPSPQQPSPQPLFSALSQPQTPLKSVQSTQLQMNNTPQPIDSLLLSSSVNQHQTLQQGQQYFTSPDRVVVQSNSSTKSTNSSVSPLSQEDLPCNFFVQSDLSNDVVLQQHPNEDKKNLLIATSIGPK